MQLPPLNAAWSVLHRLAKRASPPQPQQKPQQPFTAPRPGTSTRLADFLNTHSAEILMEWDEFAATVAHAGHALDKVTLRDHAAEILKTIALDLAQPQTLAEQDAKGKGLAPRDDTPTPAETHADYRMVAGFAIDAMITEYRALRASVLKIWAKAGGGTAPGDMNDVTRFNEAIDQSIAESVGRYTDQTKKSTDLFIGILGHDIRNPLGTILLSAEVLVRSGKLTPEAAAPITNAAQRIRGIIEQVVDFTRAQADGVMPIERKPGNIADQLFKVVQETQVRHPTRTLRVESTGTFDGFWDEGRIGQLLSNLLGNALLYGDKTSAVTLRTWGTPDEIWFSVHNLGPTIPPAERERIFQPLERGISFEPGHDGVDRTGLGLGLYICREIVHSHGGVLTVESTDADGTTFTVSLPRVAAPPAASP